MLLFCFINGKIRFLRDLKKTATLSGREKVAAGAVGVLTPGIFTGSSPRPLARQYISIDFLPLGQACTLQIPSRNQ
jgi:hypothetical protein